MSRASHHPIAGRRILVVEDEFFIAEDVAMALASFGAQVVGPEATVADALDRIAREHRLDGAVLDINLRGEKVFPVADVLAGAGVPFVFTTGYDLSQIPSRFAGFPHCTKPFAPEAVAAALVR